jgi:hypothetical protein
MKWCKPGIGLLLAVVVLNCRAYMLFNSTLAKGIGYRLLRVCVCVQTVYRDRSTVTAMTLTAIVLTP